MKYSHSGGNVLAERHEPTELLSYIVDMSIPQFIWCAIAPTGAVSCVRCGRS